MTYFWAKTSPDGRPGLSVHDHMLHVGTVACRLAEMFPELLARFQMKPTTVGAFAALHDLGKISPGFQRKCDAWLVENDLAKIARNGCWDTAMESDHGKVSHAAIQSFLPETGMDRKSAKYLAAVLGGHHGRLNPPNDRGYRPQKLLSDSASRINWDAERRATAKMVWEQLGGGPPQFPFDDEAPSLWWLAGLTSIADWIGSDERFFSPERRTSPADIAAQATTALHAIGFRTPLLKHDLTFGEIFGFPPNEMQTRALATITGPGVYVIEAPMGMGKTEAALGVAYNLMATGKANGIYFALPTQATSNRMHLRMQSFLHRIVQEPQTSRLIHGNSWLTEPQAAIAPVMTGPTAKATDDARTGRDWFVSPKRALIAPFGVGTVDQALLGVVAAKHFFLRHFALAGKVVVLDEVHSYDLYTGTLIDTLITTLEGLGCTVLVLSATLTGRRREQIVETSGQFHDTGQPPYPLISGRREGTPIPAAPAAPPQTKIIHVDFSSVEKATKEAAQLAQKGGSVLWICNTIATAQEQYLRFTGMPQNNFPIGLLHSRFPFRRRESLEAEWMERFGKDGKTRQGSILVSTQIVEQSVDLDADLLITELAPTDMLLQRLGRLWRHARGPRPAQSARICIIEETKSLAQFLTLPAREIKQQLGSKALVYDPFVLLRSLEVWRGHNTIQVPGQIRDLIDATYIERDDIPDSWNDLFYECEGKAMAHRQKAIMSSNLWNVPLPDEEGVQTRLNEMPTVSLVLCRSLTATEAFFTDQSSCRLGNDQYRLSSAQAIHKNSVKVPGYCFDRIEACPAFADYLHGDQCAGLVTENGIIDAPGLRDGIRLFYTDELGIVIEKTNKGGRDECCL